ncbi:serine proteinase inhibitor [Dictyocaulus viviparus]|uniref:Serine proteinase inhibitor n=1 Tax=Dictyocaulus viviparus TaxID=29172 RepID=A0A0D8YAK9_DICVI|nr:serine proteinase inhibitor [Dictyocaulus viviparus]
MNQEFDGHLSLRGRILQVETDFGLNMLRQTPLNQSVVVSPISVLFSLAMLQAGAKGRTKAQIDEIFVKGAVDNDVSNYFSKLLNKIITPSDRVEIRLANGFFLNKQFNIENEYKQKITRNFHAMIESLDFDKAKDSAKFIDGFIRKTTKGKIHDVVNANTVQDAYSLVVNAVYFTAKWWATFDKHSNSKAMFYTNKNTSRKIEFMNDHEVHRNFAEDDDVEVLSLPYEDTSYAFNIILPKKRTLAFRSRFSGTATYINQSHLITIPKMNMETNFKLKESLIKLGVTGIFSDDSDLSGIVKHPKLKISDATHKAIIEVDEEGTTAAATSFLQSFLLTAEFLGPPKIFVADHPFMFILTKDKNPLFMGQFV